MKKKCNCMTRREFLKSSSAVFTVSPFLTGVLGHMSADAYGAPVKPRGGIIQLHRRGGPDMLVGFDPQMENRRDELKFRALPSTLGEADLIRSGTELSAKLPIVNLQVGFGQGFRQGIGQTNPITDTANALARTAFMHVFTESADDSGGVMMDLNMAFAKAGVMGELAAVGGLSSSAAATGVAPLVNYSSADYLQISNAKQILSAASFSQYLVTGTPAFFTSMANLMKRLVSTSNVGACQTLTKSQEAYSGTQTSVYDTLVTQATPTPQAAAIPNDINILQDATLAKIWGFAAPISTQDILNNTNNIAANAGVIRALLVSATLKGYLPTVGLQDGGNDYHNQTGTTTQARDLFAGSFANAIAQTAVILNKNVTLLITADGSVGFDAPYWERNIEQTATGGHVPGQAILTGGNNEQKYAGDAQKYGNATVMFVRGDTSSPAVELLKPSMGGIAKDYTIEKNTAVSSTTQGMTAIFATLCKFHGMEDKVREVVKRSVAGLSDANIDACIAEADSAIKIG